MSEHSSPSRPSQSQMLLAAVVAMALIVVAVFVLSMQKDNPKVNEKFTQDVVLPAKQQQPIINTAELVPEQDLDTQDTRQDTETKTTSVSPSEPQSAAYEQAGAVTERSPEATVVAQTPKKLILDESDNEVRNQIAQYLAEKSLSLLVNDDMIRRMVVFVDNAAKGTIANKHMPVTRPTDAFTVLDGDIITADPNSYERYTPYADMFESLSTAQIIRLYKQFNPLILEAYEEIGYDGDEFNDTLMTAIDELLDTPVPETTLPLIKNSVTYRYAYSEWEQLSDIQKQFLRMGPNNMKKVKRRLVTLQKQLAQ